MNRLISLAFDFPASGLRASIGSVTASLTRATVKTIVDFERNVRNILSGELGMGGMRRVYNKVEEQINTWGFSTTTTVSAGISDPNGGTTAYRITAGGVNSLRAESVVYAANEQVRNSIWIRRAVGTGALSMYTGADASANSTITSTVTSSWQRIATTTVTAAGAGTGFIGIILAVSGDAVDVWHPQSEPVTGQSNQNPSEYVSSVVLATPYHGYGVDGVKYFSVENGNTVASNVVTEANGATLEGYAAGYLPGLSGSYFSTPDSVAASITGNIDIRVKVALSDWTPATAQTLIGKYTVPTVSYLFLVEVGGLLRFFGSANGSGNADAVISTVSPSTVFADGATGWVRVTKNTANGDVKFYTSHDGSIWTQLGTTVAGAVYSFFDSTAAPGVGAYAGGTAALLIGKIYRAQIYNGIDGTLAVDYNPRDWSTGSTFTSSGTGEVWTLNGGAQVLKNTILGASVEEARTQLLTSPDTFAATWAAVGTPTITAGSGRLGDVLFDLIGDDSAAALEGYTQAVVYTADATKQISFIVKVGTSTSTMVRLRDTSAPADRLLVAITWSGGVPTATYTTGTSERATEALGNGFYRIFALTSSVTAANTHSLEVYPASDNALAIAATGNVLIGGFDTTDAPVATSHIIAVGARNRDDCTHTLGAEFNAVEGTIVVTCTPTNSVLAGVAYCFDDGTVNERMLGFTGPALWTFVVTDGGVDQCSITGGAATTNAQHTLAATYKLNDFAFSTNGAAAGTDAAGTIPTVTALKIGRQVTAANYFNGHIKSLTYYPYRLSNTTLQVLSA